jgi:hypothetical protein
MVRPVVLAVSATVLLAGVAQVIRAAGMPADHHEALRATSAAA